MNKQNVIRVLLIGASMVVGAFLSLSIFESMLWKSVFCGLFSLIVYCSFVILYQWGKAMKDSDVQIASELRMSVKRYRHYQRLYDEYQDYMEKHGINFHASEEKFKEIFKQIDNPNEWRRYSAYREEKARLERMNEIYRWQNEG